MSRIFISYRRSDSISEAGRIYDYLSNHFGRESIFKDVDDIDAGDDFRDRVTQAVGQCQILLAVIGTSWLQATDAAGNRRLDNPADWVRLEIETALKRNIRVIPVLLTGVEMPLEQALPNALQPLAYRNAARVRHDPDFQRDMERVVEVIARHFEGLAQPSAAAQAIAPPRPGASHAEPKHSAFGQNGKEKPLARLGTVISRRRAIQVLGFTGGGLGTLLIGRQLFQAKKPLSEADFKTVRFNTVTVNDNGDKISQEDNEARVFHENIEGIPLDMVWIPGETFMMGSPATEIGRDEDTTDEDLPREVTIQSFLMGRYEVTQAQWRKVAVLEKIDIDLKTNPAQFSEDGDNRPVENVNWFEAVEFCKRLSDYTGREYRLPSEAEWEYACRARATTPFHFGETLTAELANYRATKAYKNEDPGKYRGTTTDVDTFGPNSFGLYDMHGNVWEWCADHWYDNTRVLRGGAWFSFPRNCRSAIRGSNSPKIQSNGVGFRVSCSCAPRILS